MLKKILIGLVAIVAVALLVGLFLPSKVTVARTVTIDRPASLVFATVDSFQLFPKWSPWQELDPNMHQSTEGPREGIGATLVWSGNDKVGKGTQVITAQELNARVDSDLNFEGMGSSKSVMSFRPTGKSTWVTWTVTLDMGVNPIAHYIGLTMDHVLGPQFASGLSKLKTLVESMPDQDIAALQAEAVQLEAASVLLVSETAPREGIARAFADGYGQIGKFMAKNKLRQAGAPFSLEGAMTAGSHSFEAGIPVDRADAVDGDGVRAGTSYAGTALKTVHTGAYGALYQSLEKLQAYGAAHGYANNGAPIFRFIDDPGKVPESALRTEIYTPVLSDALKRGGR